MGKKLRGKRRSWVGNIPCLNWNTLDPQKIFRDQVELEPRPVPSYYHLSRSSMHNSGLKTWAWIQCRAEHGTSAWKQGLTTKVTWKCHCIKHDRKKSLQFLLHQNVRDIRGWCLSVQVYELNASKQTSSGIASHADEKGSAQCTAWLFRGRTEQRWSWHFLYL